MRLLLRQGLRHHRKKPLQTLLTVLGIAAGVALLCAMRLSQRTAVHAFDRAVEAVAGRATHTVTNGADGVPTRAYAELRRRLGGRGIAPAVQAIARVPDAERRTVLRVLGVDPFADVDLRPWAGPRAAGVPVGALVATENAFVATPELLARLGVAAGDELAITVGGRPFAATCLGPIEPPDGVRSGLADTLVVDVATAQEWTGRLDRVDRLDLRLGPADLPRGEAADPAAAEVLVREVVGPGVRLERAGAGSEGLTQLTRGFRINVTALSLLSLLVGAFLVHETMRLSVVARRRSFGVLRALGAQGRSIGAVVALEAMLLGVVGSALGAALGVLAAHALLEPIVRTLNDHYATFAVPTLDVDPTELLVCAGSGVLVTVLAGLGPAVAASRVSPRTVLVRAGGGESAGPARGWRWYWAVPPALASAALLLTVGTRLVQGYFGMLLMLAAAVLLMPTLMQWVLRAFGWPLGRLGPFARYVVRSTAAARAHLALPMAAMVLAVATTIGMAVLVSSFRGSVAGWLGSVLPADVYVSVPGGVDERSQPIEPAITAALRRDAQVADCTIYYRTLMPLEGGQGAGLPAEVEVVGMDASPAWLAQWPLLDGDRDAARAAIAAQASDASAGAWISEPLAFRRALSVGDRVTLGAGDAASSLPIVAIYRDYSSERGEVLVGRDWLQRRVQTAGVTALGIELARDGAALAAADVEAACARLSAAAADAADDTTGQGVLIRSQRDLRETSLQIFDRTFAITGVMRLLCLMVAFFGIYSAFAALQLERGAEVGLLRCLGALPSRIGVVVIGQTALLGACAAVLAIPLGLLIGQLLAHVINRVSFGWSLVEVTVPGRALLEATALSIVAALLAGLWPAWRFARMRPATALRES